MSATRKPCEHIQQAIRHARPTWQGLSETELIALGELAEAGQLRDYADITELEWAALRKVAARQAVR